MHILYSFCVRIWGVRKGDIAPVEKNEIEIISHYVCWLAFFIFRFLEHETGGFQKKVGKLFFFVRGNKLDYCSIQL